MKKALIICNRIFGYCVLFLFDCSIYRKPVAPPSSSSSSIDTDEERRRGFLKELDLSPAKKMKKSSSSKDPPTERISETQKR